MSRTRTTAVQFGDGKTADRFTALGKATLGSETEAGVVILEPSTTSILVGMEFLKKFNKSLVMYRGVIFLVDEKDIDEFIKQAVDHMQKSTAPAAPADGQIDPPIKPN